MTFVEVCAVSALPPGECQKIENGERPVAVFNIDGTFYAIDDTCTHGNWSLSEGYVEGSAIECSLHSAKFCIRTGKVLAAPAYLPLRTYPVKVENGVVFVDLEGGVYAGDTITPCKKGGKHGLA